MVFGKPTGRAVVEDPRDGLDPAVAASPIITTIVDACALSIYFAVAKAFMGL